MTDQNQIKDEIFPKGTGKTYSLVELVRRDDPMVGKGPDNTVFSFPIVILWEIVLILGVHLIIAAAALIKNAPLYEIANPLFTIDPAKAPWYLVWVQELLEHMHPLLAGVIIPTILIAFLVAVPYIDNSKEHRGVWFGGTARIKKITFGMAAYTMIIMPLYIFMDNAFPLREILRESAPQWVVQFAIPGLIMFSLVLIPTIILYRFKADTHEIITALFTFIILSAFVFMLSGFLFRGPGFKLYLPWDMPGGYNPWDEF